MVRPNRAPWVLIVSLVLGCGAAAAAAAPRLSARGCVRYSQKMDRDHSGVTIRLANRCPNPVTCSVEWTLVCAGKSGGTESVHVALERGAAEAIRASAASCGDGEWWEIAGIQWSCTPREP